MFDPPLLPAVINCMALAQGLSFTQFLVPDLRRRFELELT